MEWMILVVLVPAVIVPVVLLFGFAGCAQFAGIEEITFVPLPPPTTTTPPGPTATWQPDFNFPAMQAAAQTVSYPGSWCLVQVLPGFPADGTGIRITVRAASTPLTITQASVSHARQPYKLINDPWSSAGTPEQLFEVVTGAAQVTVNKGDKIQLELKTPFSAPRGNWIVAFDIASGEVPLLPVTNYIAYINLGATDAMKEDRIWFPTPTLQPAKDKTLMLIEKIETLR